MDQISPYTILISSNGMGNGDQELKHRLIKTYLNLLLANDYFPSVIAFYTEGVRLLTADSPVLELLRSLEENGVRLIACGTCLEYYGIQDKLKVGIPGGMTDILEAQWRAEKVITL